MKIKNIPCNKYNYGGKRSIRKLEAIVIQPSLSFKQAILKTELNN